MAYGWVSTQLFCRSERRVTPSIVSGAASGRGATMPGRATGPGMRDQAGSRPSLRHFPRFVHPLDDPIVGRGTPGELGDRGLLQHGPLGGMQVLDDRRQHLGGRFLGLAGGSPGPSIAVRTSPSEICSAGRASRYPPGTPGCCRRGPPP